MRIVSNNRLSSRKPINDPPVTAVPEGIRVHTRACVCRRKRLYNIVTARRSTEEWIVCMYTRKARVEVKDAEKQRRVWPSRRRLLKCVNREQAGEQPTCLRYFRFGLSHTIALAQTEQEKEINLCYEITSLVLFILYDYHIVSLLWERLKNLFKLAKQWKQ